MLLHSFSVFEGCWDRCSATTPEENKTFWHVLPYRWEPAMVCLLITGLPGKGSKCWSSFYLRCWETCSELLFKRSQVRLKVSHPFQGAILVPKIKITSLYIEWGTTRLRYFTGRILPPHLKSVDFASLSLHRTQHNSVYNTDLGIGKLSLNAHEKE